MNQTRLRVIGIDVASKTLDINDSENLCPRQIPNKPAAIARRLLATIDDPARTRIVCEATGGYEAELVDAALDAGVTVVVANPRQVRDFAKGHGLLEKTDTLDAAIIRRFGEDVVPVPVRPRSAEEKHLSALVRRRCQILKMLLQEQNRLRTTADPVIRKMLQESISTVKSRLKQLDRMIATLVRGFRKTDSRVEILESVPGVGPVTTAVVLAMLPELGQISRGQIAKLVGVAPLARQSGTSDKPRRTRGGRVQVRRTLYMATLAATKHNPAIRTFYRRLVAAGKRRKVALVAAMRKLLTILNGMMCRKEKWGMAGLREKKKEAALQLSPVQGGLACSMHH